MAKAWCLRRGTRRHHFGHCRFLLGRVGDGLDCSAKIEVIAALAEICLRQSKHDPQIAQRLIELRKTVRYNRSYLIMKAGWATMPGTTEANRQVATACVEKLGL